ncbi:transposase domain-containing protein [Escherichia coli]
MVVSGALLYSLIGTCKLNDVDPESYLRHVLGVKQTGRSTGSANCFRGA